MMLVVSLTLNERYNANAAATALIALNKSFFVIVVVVVVTY